MTPRRTFLIPAFLLLLSIHEGASAQSDALELESMRQRISHALRLRQLARKQIAVKFERAPLDLVARDLGRAIGVPVVPSRGVLQAVESGALAPLDLVLPRGPASTVLAAVRARAGVLFAHRGRTIAMLLTGEFAPRPTTRIYGVRALTFRLRDFPSRTRFGLRGSNDRGEEEVEEPGERTVSGYDEDGLVELIRGVTGEAAWESDQFSIHALRGALLVRQTPRVHLAIERLLAQLH